MVIYFTETEKGERAYFSEALADHDLRFVKNISQVDEDVEILSPFIYSQVDADFIASHPNLKFVSTRSTGYDHIDIGACREKGIHVSTVPSYGDNTVAEHTFALILALSRRLREALETVEKRSSSSLSFESIRGFDLYNKTLGVIGTGRIGLHTIRIAKAFNMRVLAYDLKPQPFMAEILGFEYVSFPEILAQSDILTLHIPLFPETHHLINPETLAQCKKGVILINTARGGLIDTNALIEALDNGQVGGAGLDVLEEERILQVDSVQLLSRQIIDRLHSEVPATELVSYHPKRVAEIQQLMRNSDLIHRPNVIFTPHVAFNSVEAVDRINSVTVANIQAFLKEAPTNVVTS